jgi:hypothetical protein
MVFCRETGWKEEEEAVEARDGVCNITDISAAVDRYGAWVWVSVYQNDLSEILLQYPASLGAVVRCPRSPSLVRNLTWPTG